jgi:hypothetical protein
MDNAFITVPEYNNGTWGHRAFSTREEFRDYLVPLFKEPGQYNFDETSLLFNNEARVFNENKVFCISPQGTKDFKIYWDTQKERCRNGALFHSNGNTWYLPRDYYMWLNFLPIFNKETNKFGFADVRDAQYHMALYEILAELHYRHSPILKKRQIASSYFHAGKLINQIWFEEGITLKMGASLKDYINDKGTWKFLNEYESFLNRHTAWYRPMNPNKVLLWQQKIEISQGSQKRKTEVGLKGVLQGMSFEKDPTNGVGGPCKYFFHEEAGIAPKMDVTYEYIRPAMKSGFITTGMFIAAGSVGDLDQCEPLKDFILNPDAHDMYGIESKLIDNKGTVGKTGLFIPEQWSMPPFIDQYGNSKVDEALTALDQQFAQWKKDLSPEQYQLRISQHPRNIEEAFAFRKVSLFPQHLVSAQTRRIEEKEYSYEFVELSRDEKGIIKSEVSNKLPISEFPVSKNQENKEGVIVVYERPDKDPQFGTYYASIDPVSEGKTTTSDSLCSIYIYKNPVEVTVQKAEGSSTYIERDKIVASWCGRFDDINKTHERLELLIEWYNAWTLVENNISLFIQHMIHRKKQRYLVPKNQVTFLKDLGANNNVYQEYGWKNTGRMFKDHLLNYLIEFLREEIDIETKSDGTIVKTTYGIERIPDLMAMKEMQAYTEGLNVDRLVSLASLIAFAKIQQANRGYKKKYEVDPNLKLDNSKNFSKLGVSPFRHMGSSGSSRFNSMPRNPFKNLR